jgi:DNA helicase-2/ATP-dependent DNA helicase PcrA
MDQAQWDIEQKRLESVYGRISRELSRREQEVKAYKKNTVATRRSIWEEGNHTWQYLDIDAAVEVKQSLDVLKQESQRHRIAQRQLIKLQRLIKSPYFGRIDFKEKDFPDTEEIYIGITSFFDERGDILIYDWRAPVSSIFYDFELGPAYYKCLDGKIEGTVSLKRQYRINGSRLEFMIDTGIKIDDELLQEILSKNTDEKMRNIVNTIQKEQNRIIRDEEHQLLMVQGVAGSGKTSIALHRIAYLLYKYRDENMTSGNILIFSPNTVFNDYISNVLPELGEENMQQTTFDEYIEKMADKGLMYESSSAHMEYILTSGSRKDQLPRVLGITYKSSVEFYRLLNDYAHYLEFHAMRFRDIKFREQVIISESEIRRLFYEDYSYLPLARRLEKMRIRLLYLIRPAWQQRLKELQEELLLHPEYKSKAKAYSRLYVYKEFKSIREEIDDMLKFELFQVFVDLFSNTDLFVSLAGESLPEHYKEICEYTASWLKNNVLGYEDVSAYVYLKGLLEGVPSMRHIRHVVVDEAQDYTPVQYGILKQLFPGTRMTLLGDFNQTINPLKGTFQYQAVTEVLAPTSQAVLQLTKGYRSTTEIVSFTRSILKNQQIESIQRHGEKPQLYHVADPHDMTEQLVNDVKGLLDDGMESVGIICKTAEKSRQLYEKIRKKLRASLLTSDDVNFSRGIVVLPVYLAKGLEFDAAVVFGADAEHYGLERDRRLFYTACTRALHKLHLFYSGKASPFIEEIPGEYYERA